MNKKIFITILTISFFATGCIKPFPKPEFVIVEPSQTAYLIPLIGDTSNQQNFESIEFLNEYKIATKEIQIPKREVKIGRWRQNVEYRPSARVIVVERKPETRVFGNTNGVFAESKESIGFKVKMNITAQIEEKDASVFLYRYNNKPLEAIIDDEIRALAIGTFTEEVAKLPLIQIQQNKEEIMNNVRDKIIPYFKEKGITITVVSLLDGLEYDNKDIQTAIDDKYKSEQEIITQSNINEKNISEAEANYEIISKQAETYTKSIELKKIENEKAWIEKWNGQLPQVQSGENGAFIYNLNNK